MLSPKRALINSLGMKGIKSSMPSPIPIPFIGILYFLVMPIKEPPLA